MLTLYEHHSTEKLATVNDKYILYPLIDFLMLNNLSRTDPMPRHFMLTMY